MINREVVYQYVGKGRWLVHVPKRDLTAHDLVVFNIDENTIVKSGLYRKVEPPKPKKVYKSSKKESE